MDIRNFMGLSLLFLVIALPVATSEDAVSSLEGITWSLDSYLNSDNKSVGLMPSTEITASFDSGVVSGHSGCNNYQGGYVPEGWNITFSKIISTLMICMDNISTQEYDYLLDLQKVARYNISGNLLMMMDSNGTKLLIYSAVKPKLLAATNWRMLSYNNGLGLASALAETNITAVFDSDGGLTGLAGCNNYKASYKTVNNTINISPIVITRKFCFEPKDIMEQEDGYLAALKSATRYRIERQQLHLFFENASIAAIFENLTAIAN